MSDLTCGGCQFWVRLREEGPRGVALLGREAVGQCRFLPPQAMPTGDGMVVCDYPRLQESFPACAQFRPVPVVGNGEGRQTKIDGPGVAP